MKLKNTAFVLLLATTICFAACKESNSSNVETTEITQMDSTSKRARDASKQLEDQTKKVEESIEKLDEEFKTNN